MVVAIHPRACRYFYVVWSNYAEWTKYIDMSREFIKDLPETFPHAQGRFYQNHHKMTYVVKRAEGFKGVLLPL